MPYTFITPPTNVVEHHHHGHRYLWALTPSGELAQARLLRAPRATAWVWSRCELVKPQTEVEDDPNTGEAFAPDPVREAYIAAIRVMLETTW